MTAKPLPTEPGILAFHARCEAFYPADAVDAPIGQQRQWYDALCREFDAVPPVGMVKSDGLVEGRIAIRHYRPAEVKTQTQLLYIHGGGFVVGSLDSHDAICAEISDTVGAELVAVDYRLAREHVWPAAFEDCWAVLSHLLADGRPLVVVGDSAGGNLAAGIALKARDEGLSGLVGQALIYPGLGGDHRLPSRSECSDAPLLSSSDLDCYHALYLRGTRTPGAYAMPLLAGDLRGLPPAWIAVAQFDPLRDDGVLYAERLNAAGVAATLYYGEGLVHGCLRARGQVEEVDVLYETLLGFLAKKLAAKL